MSQMSNGYVTCLDIECQQWFYCIIIHTFGPLMFNRGNVDHVKNHGYLLKISWAKIKTTKKQNCQTALDLSLDWFTLILAWYDLSYLTSLL
jgi:hypothetical protein